MVFKRSEYGLKYKKSYLENNVPVYYNNVAYRTHRRQLEHAHTPLSWDFEDTSDSKNSSAEDVSNQLQKTLQITEEYDQQDGINVAEENEEQDLVDQARSKLEKYESKHNKDTDAEKADVNKMTVDQDVILDKQSKLKDDDFKKKTFCKEIPSIKQSTTEPRQLKDAEPLRLKDAEPCLLRDELKLSLESDEDKKMKKRIRSQKRERPKSSPVYKPPFLAYGCGDRERETGVKRSFNVRASNDVYPAAMKALVNLHEQQKKREKNRKCLSARERKRKALIQEKAAKEVAGWQSEYQLMYPKYNHDEYARSASRLQNRPQCFKPYKF